jgi:hypothetical protein
MGSKDQSLKTQSNLSLCEAQQSQCYYPISQDTEGLDTEPDNVAPRALHEILRTCPPILDYLREQRKEVSTTPQETVLSKVPAETEVHDGQSVDSAHDRKDKVFNNEPKEHTGIKHTSAESAG